MLRIAPATHTIPKHSVQQRNSLALYIHVPFCRVRCTYCAFNTYTRLADQIAPYVEALIREIQWLGSAGQKPAAHTVYFGGGTPSLLPVDSIARVLDTCALAFSLADNTEITLEANPGTVTEDYLCDLRRAGVTRLSLGMQSVHADELRLFGRLHRKDDIATTVSAARRAGFDNLSLDLIYGVPRQTLAMWQASLDAALLLSPEHLSLYSLSVEEGTPFATWVEHGKLEAPDADLAADMYEWATDRLAAEGYAQYEISNWSKPGFACQHNVHVWRNRPYLGLGPGAYGYANQTRYSNTLLPADYIGRLGAQTDALPFPLSAAADEIEHIDTSAEIVETMITGLRLTQEGISARDFQARFGRSLWDVYDTPIRRMIQFGLLETHDDRICLTRRGRLLGNRVFAEFV